MKFYGTHRTVYSFGTPVTLDMHTIRLTPRSGGGQLLKKFSLHIDPEPCAITEFIDAEGNAQQRCWFAGKADRLVIETCFEGENRRENPYDYIPSDSAVIPMAVEPPDDRFLRLAQEGGVDPTVQVLAQQQADRCGRSAAAYVLQAMQWVYEHIRYEARVDGHPRSPAETLRMRCGACRDTAVLLMSLCRAMSIPARFVSGYQEGDPDIEQHDLHAWAEAWIPGGGWRGFDPTHGLAVADRHIPLEASSDSALAAPVSGGFYGNHAKAEIPEHHIQIKFS